jgi:AraC-like DNA-binding protein
MRRMGDSEKGVRPFSGRGRRAPVTYRGTPSCSEAGIPTCVALITGCDDRTRLGAALHGTAAVTFVAAVGDVLPLLRGDRLTVRAVVLEAHDAAGRPTAGLARQITRLFPATPVIGYCSLRAEGSQDILALASAGVHELIFKEMDEHAALLRNLLRSAEQASAAHVVLNHLGEGLPARIRPLVEYCLTNPEEAHSVDQVARALGINRKTLLNRCSALGFPPPGAVIAWSLLLLTTALLAAPGVTVERVAVQLNYPSATALRNMLKRHTGLRPTDLRRAGALAELCTRFLARHARDAGGSR